MKNVLIKEGDVPQFIQLLWRALARRDPALPVTALIRLVLRPQEMKEAKKNAENVYVQPDDLLNLEGRGDGYFRDKSSRASRRIQVKPIGPTEK